MSQITVIKRDLQGQETWRYTGKVLERGHSFVVLEASFNREDLPFHGIVLKRGDRFVETYYSDRWYNIFEIFDHEDGCFKAWYCNISYPAEIDHQQISYIDLALDLLVYPDGQQLILDEDEFLDMHLSPEMQFQAVQALEELQNIFKQKTRDSNGACP
jgi:predicted RNA-binding protein associated with RNAse of E/G family